MSIFKYLWYNISSAQKFMSKSKVSNCNVINNTKWYFLVKGCLDLGYCNTSSICKYSAYHFFSLLFATWELLGLEKIPMLTKKKNTSSRKLVLLEIERENFVFFLEFQKRNWRISEKKSHHPCLGFYVLIAVNQIKIPHHKVTQCSIIQSPISCCNF